MKEKEEKKLKLIQKAFSAGMLLLTPLTLGLAFYAVYKNPVFLPLVFVALLPASFSCIGIANLRRLFRNQNQNKSRETK